MILTTTMMMTTMKTPHKMEFRAAVPLVKASHHYSIACELVMTITIMKMKMTMTMRMTTTRAGVKARRAGVGIDPLLETFYLRSNPSFLAGSSTSSGDHFNTHWRQSAAGIRRAAPPHPFQLANVLANVNHGVHLGQESLARTRDLLPRSAAGREVFWSLEEDGQSHDPDASDSSQTLRGHDEEVSEDYESDIG
jgi:hypothetical protein